MVGTLDLKHCMPGVESSSVTVQQSSSSTSTKQSVSSFSNTTREGEGQPERLTKVKYTVPLLAEVPYRYHEKGGKEINVKEKGRLKEDDGKLKGQCHQMFRLRFFIK